MGTYRYALYGLQIETSYALPGVDSTARQDSSLPVLALEVCGPGDLDASWPRTFGTPDWRGRMGNGTEMSISRGAAGEVFFSYGDKARFVLRAGMERLACAPLYPGLEWQQVLIGKVLACVSVIRGYEALHAAAVDSTHGVIGIMGPSGAGKSTLTAELVRRGYRLFADDQLTLDRTGRTVLAYPGSPHMNMATTCPIDPDLLGTTLGLISDERWVAARSVGDACRPVHMLFMLERRAGLRLEATPMTASPLLLAPYMLGLWSNATRERSRFYLYADLLETAPVVRLTAGVRDPVEKLADLVDSTLLRGAMSATESVA
jgi:hypothetical protein